MTDRVVETATRCASPGTTVIGVTARFGVSIVSTEASLLTACLLGRRFGLLSFGQSSGGMYLDLVQSAGLVHRMAAFETIDLANSASYLRGVGGG